MHYIQAVVLAIVQGIAEFLPISSSGHLVIIPRLLGWTDPGLKFDIVLHAGSLLALVVYFWQDIKKLFLAFFGITKDAEARRFAWVVLIGSIPAVIAGAVLGSKIEEHFRDVRWVGLFMLCAGSVYALTTKFLAVKPGAQDQPGWKQALTIGLAQVMALFPGVSRSGSTTWTGTRLGLSHANAAKYSFFLGMVAIAGAAAKTAWDVVKGKDVVAFPTGALVVGFVVSALVSFAVIRWLLNFFRKHTLVPFGVYLMVLGAIVLVWPWK